MTTEGQRGSGRFAEDDLVDWALATAAARRFSGPGPSIDREQAAEVVAQLRSSAARAQGYVQEFTGLQAPADSAPVLIVDRPGWIQANADGMRELMAPLERKLRAERKINTIGGIGPKATGLQAGVLLGFLAGKVLGQFDPFWPPAGRDGAAAGQRSGRLLLVAPNVVHVERELNVDPSDFRLWVALHEEAHRVQFTAVPWLRDHLAGQVEEFVAATDLDPGTVVAQLRQAVRAAAESLRSGARPSSVLDMVSSPAQRAVIDRLTGLMSLLEGHAEVVMDGVGPAVIGSVDTIRRRFQRRRSSATGLDRTLRRLLGFEAKMRQYRDGAAFVKAVIAEVGMPGFNRVWESADSLPSKAEIADPRAWVRRVHGSDAVPPAA